MSIIFFLFFSENFFYRGLREVHVENIALREGQRTVAKRVCTSKVRVVSNNWHTSQSACNIVNVGLII